MKSKFRWANSILKISFSLTFCCFFSSNSLSQSSEWAVQLDEYGSGTQVDKYGNSFTSGSFHGTVDFDPGSGTHFLTSINYTESFIQKLDSSGNLVWVIQIANNNNGPLGFDASGNIYIIGSFFNTVDFDPGVGTYNLTSTNGEQELFYLKLDSNANFIWAKQTALSHDNYYTKLVFDSSNNIYAAGFFMGTADFDPSSVINNLSSYTATIEGYDSFISKLDSAGNLIWIKQLFASLNCQIRSINIDEENNIYTTGFFQDTVDFDPNVGVHELVGVDGGSAFIQKLDSMGNLIWVNQIKNNIYTGYDKSIGTEIEVDALQNIYVVGTFTGVQDFDFGAAVFEIDAGDNYDIFIQKLDSAGNFIWTKQIGGKYFECSAAIYLDSLKNIYLTGQFEGTVDFDPGPAVQNLTAYGSGYVNGSSIIISSPDIFIEKLDSSGNLIWLGQIGNLDSDYANAIDLDYLGNVYISGGFANTVDFKPGNDSLFLTESTINEEHFIVKLNQPINGITPVFEASEVKIYPNPTTGLITIYAGDLYKGYKIEIYDYSGNAVFSNYTYSLNTVFDLKDLAQGIYIVRLTNSNETITQKILKLDK